MSKTFTYTRKHNPGQLYEELLVRVEGVQPVMGSLGPEAVMTVESKGDEVTITVPDTVDGRQVAGTVAAHDPAHSEARRAAEVQFHKDVMAFVAPIVGMKADKLIALLDQHRFRVAQLYKMGALNTDWTIKPLHEWLGHGTGNGQPGGDKGGGK